MDNCKKFNDLTAHLRELFKSASYSESTVKDMDFILRSFTNFMNANGMDEYSPEMGEILIRYCKETLKVCDSRVSRAKVIVAKLNRLYQGLDGEEALWTDKTVPVELPDSLSKALDSFILHCRHNGNKHTTLYYKRWICSRFLKNLEYLGCQCLQNVTGELIQSAFLQLGYLRYWERIGPFLRYLFESGQLQRDFSGLIVNRKKYAPQPTVYTQEEVSAIEDSVDCSTAVGIRNFAIRLLLSRYGIRSRDISALQFENLDFENDRIHFTQQKTGDLWEMELFPEVKAALKDYILTARPNVPECQNVFLTAIIPYKPLDSYAINTAVGMLVTRSGVSISEKRHGSRAFRSSIASNMVNDRVSTEVVRKVLGHGTKHAIRHYARMDIENMRLCPLHAPKPDGIFSELLSWKEDDVHV